MSQPNYLQRLADEVLTQLEMRETPLLNWGMVGGSLFAVSEVGNILGHPPTPMIKDLWNTCKEDGASPQILVEDLVRRRLLFYTGVKHPETGEKGYRTRYADTIRLLYLLKQRFKREDWFHAPNLVSHIKSEVAYRKYPKRNRDWVNVRDVLQAEYQQRFPFLLKVWDALIGESSIKLAAFQVDSLLHISRKTGRSKDSGTIIGAGTGSGKTKAFYLPALGHIALSVFQDQDHWNRLIGLYPRTELLKDQFREALSQLISLNGLLKDHSRRPLKIGGYYADTPPRAQDVMNNEYYRWEKAGDGYICPFVTCPHPQCSKPMLWLEEDIKRADQSNGLTGYQFERLVCSDSSCGTTLEAENIVLTRKRMEAEPPDLLFTTTEMLNRKLASLQDQHVFGIKGKSAPLYLLLDEVHIHEGVSGAHVAYLLRRWRKLVSYYRPGQGIHFAGLSATLPEPQAFFAGLVGIEEGQVTYISPSMDEMSSEGAEYNLVLRGDPFSATALLSTSVQTTMLLGRMFDPLHGDVSGGAWGKKIFGFTDKLDVINRWFHIEKDAEENKVLSSLRYPEGITDPREKAVQRRLGQIWESAHMIDKDSLRNPMIIDITSSQNKGVDARAKLVIATSTLEVGYNDTEVGGVIQHKAPRNLASFLQRKGRAGRRVGMRPWTIVVTSAYGRDRFVYDYPEHLYSPDLPALSLPLRNPYIQRIQLTFAFMDWLGIKLLEAGFKGSVWNVLAPRSKGYFLREKELIKKIVHDVLNGNDQHLIGYLYDVLRLTPTALKRVLWLPPRSLMLDVLPVLLAQIETDFSQKIEHNQIVKVHLDDDAPLRGYVPRNLFSSLEASEIVIYPPQGKPQSMGLLQGLIEFAPGNVSKRYVNVNKIWQAHWWPLPEKGSNIIDFSDKKSPITLRDVVTFSDEKVGAISVWQPGEIQLQQLPNTVSDRSTGFLQWEVQIEPMGDEGVVQLGNDQGILLIPNGLVTQLISKVIVFSNDKHQYVRFTRYAPRVMTEVKYKNGEGERRMVSFSYKNGAAALGYQVDVDALGFVLQEIHVEKLAERENWKELLTQIRPAFYLHKLQNDSELSGLLSHFEIYWMSQICLASIIGCAIGKDCEIKEAIEIYQKQIVDISKRTLDVIFHATTVRNPLVQNEAEDSQDDSKLKKRLIAYIESPSVMKYFLGYSDLLWQELTVDEEFWLWIKQRVHTSIAASLQKVMQELLPDLNIEDLIVDIQEGVIWFSESSSGGLGIVSTLASKLGQQGRHLEEIFYAAISQCRRHEVAKSLSALLSYLSDEFITDAFRKIRESVTLDEQEEGIQSLRNQLRNIGITPRRDVVMSIIRRFLYTNTSEKTDQLVKDLHNLWHLEETRLGCKIDPRVFTVACLKREDFAERIDEVFFEIQPGIPIDSKNRYLLVETLLWTDCHDACPECLQLYSPFQSFAQPSRELLIGLVTPVHMDVKFGDHEWMERIKDGLMEGKVVRLHTLFDDINGVQDYLFELFQTPLEWNYELFYPYLAGVHNSGRTWRFDLQVREVSHD